LRRLRVAERSLAIADPAERWASWFAGFAGPGRRRILHPDLARSLADPAGRATHESWRARAAGRDPLTGMLYVDVKTWLADDLLMKMDRMSMAASLEARVPFLDHRVVDLAFSFPPEWKRGGGRGKRILYEAFGAALPEAVRTRPKAGFPVPLDLWFRTGLRDLVRDALDEAQVARRGLLSPIEVRRVVEDHAAGRRDHGREIWTLLNLELWQRVFLDPPRAPRVAPAGGSEP
jgi:asparagine synthase (glutamine-hydrolysing)